MKAVIFKVDCFPEVSLNVPSGKTKQQGSGLINSFGLGIFFHLLHMLRVLRVLCGVGGWVGWVGNKI